MLHNNPLQSRPLNAKAQLFNVAALLSCICFGSYSAHAVVPTGFEETIIATGLVQPTAMTFAPDGRLFVLEQAGRVRIIQNGTLLPTPFASLSVRSDWERGLLGIAFDPNFATNRYLYLYYTTTSNRNRLSRFRASATNPNLVEAGSEIQLIADVGINAGNHNGGAIKFGLDGMLYVAIGEHGDTSNSQNLSSLGGKILRLHVTNYPNSIIPSDNPFVSQSGARGEVYAYGLRNPFTFNVDAQNGRIYINDVGGVGDEEIDQGASGANYGWPTCPGGACSIAGITSPVFSYRRVNGACAITGGTFYRGTNFPAEYAGHYFFSDYCGNFIRRLRPDNTAVDWGTGFGAPVGLEVGPDGHLYVLEWEAGEVTRIRFAGSSSNANPTVSVSATPTSGQAPLTVAFTATASDPDNDPLTYSWDFGDSSSGTTRTPSHTYTRAGSYTARVTVSDGRGGSASATASISVGNAAPIAVIATPVNGARYRAGDTLTLAGSATDSEDGVLPASAFSWLVRFHHDTHFHPVLGPLVGSSTASFQTASVGEVSTNVWYRLTLTVTDSGGLTHSVTRDIHPSTVTYTLQTQPGGLQVLVDGTLMSSPQIVGSVINMQRGIGVTTPQTLSGRTYEFVSWSDGGTAEHSINAPITSTTYTATFRDITAGNNACDVNTSGASDIVDVQICVNQAIGVAGCSTGDINNDTQCNVIDVQRVVNAVLGGACVTQ